MKNTIKRKKQQSSYKLRVRGELKRKLLAYLENKHCIDCLEYDPIVLEFDHVKGIKISGIANMVNDCKPWKETLTEIKKCEIRCANCHRKKTHKQLNYWKQI